MNGTLGELLNLFEDDEQFKGYSFHKSICSNENAHLLLPVILMKNNIDLYPMDVFRFLSCTFLLITLHFSHLFS